MSLRRLRELHPEAADDLEDQARRLRFSADLTESLATTLLLSIQGGDGKLWSDSFLVMAIVNDACSLRTLIDRLPEHRSHLVSEKDFRATLVTRKLGIDATFQTPLHDELLLRARNETTELTEAGLLLTELEAAQEWFTDTYSLLGQFAAQVAEPVFRRALCCTEKAAERAWRRLAYLIEDAICVSMMCRRHPFDAFDGPSVPPHQRGNRDERNVSSYRSISNDYSRKQFSLARRRFYWMAIDTVGVGIELTDADLIQFVTYFDHEHFRAVCDEMDGIEVHSEHVEDDKEDALRVMQSQCFFAAQLLLNSRVPMALLVNRLASWKVGDEASWPTSSRLIVSLGSRSIEVSRMDVTSAHVRDSVSAPSGALVRPAQVGLWAPSPIWTDTVLERFEFMINRPDVKEREIQSFFELYPQFILDELHVEAHPQVMLFRRTGGDLRPDFVIRRLGSDLVDIVELKLPSASVVHGPATRPTVSRAVSAAIAQLKEYREWFRDASNRRLFRKRYGLDGFEPRLCLVIGRRSHLLDEETRRRAFSELPIRVVTYDDLCAAVRRRREWLVG